MASTKIAKALATQMVTIYTDDFPSGVVALLRPAPEDAFTKQELDLRGDRNFPERNKIRADAPIIIRTEDGEPVTFTKIVTPSGDIVLLVPKYPEP